MNVRFVIRKNGSARTPWALRDALCAQSEHHTFLRKGWGDECTGLCEAFASHPEAIERLKWAQ